MLLFKSLYPALSDPLPYEVTDRMSVRGSERPEDWQARLGRFRVEAHRQSSFCLRFPTNPSPFVDSISKQHNRPSPPAPEVIILVKAMVAAH